MVAACPVVHRNRVEAVEFYLLSRVVIAMPEQLKMKPSKPRFTNGVAQIFNPFLCIRDTANSFHVLVKLVEREHALTVDLVIVRASEIHRHPTITKPLEFVKRNV